MDSATRALFEHHQTLRAVVDSVLEGHLGCVRRIDDRGAIARLDIGCYAIFGGDSDDPRAAELIREVRPPAELVPGVGRGWGNRLRSLLGSRLSERPMHVFRLDGGDRVRRELRARMRACPPEVELRSFDVELAARLDSRLAPHAMQVFASPEDFVARGVGVAAVVGDELVGAATSYAMSRKRVEVAISTREEWRRRGLAMAVAAALIAECLDKDLQPDWCASNPVSQRLAIRLGYRRVADCPILLLEGNEPERIMSVGDRDTHESGQCFR